MVQKINLTYIKDEYIIKTKREKPEREGMKRKRSPKTLDGRINTGGTDMELRTYSLEIARRRVNRNERIWKLTYPSGVTVFIIVPQNKEGKEVLNNIVKENSLFRGFSLTVVKR
jgi:hypothetical protein